MIDRLLGAFGRGRAVRAVLMAAVLGSCAGTPDDNIPPPAAAPADEDGAVSAADGGWVGRPVQGLPAGARLWDVDVDDSGVFVAVGTISVGDYDTELPLVVWRSEDGLTWQEAFRRDENLVDPGDASGRPSQAAVAAHPDGFAVVGGTCPDHRCRPLALRSADGDAWHEVEVPFRSLPTGAATAAPSGGGGGDGSAALRQRLIAATPSYTIQGAEMLDVVAAGTRLVAVGWVEGPRHSTANAAWHSDDGGRTWRQAPDGAFPGRDASRDELDRVLLAGDRLVAGGGNRCCHTQAVGELWVSEHAGDRWRPVSLPDHESVTIADLAAGGDAVHLLGWAGDFGEQPVHWRLPAGDHWQRLPSPPRSGQLLAPPAGLTLVAGETTAAAEQRRLVSFHSPDDGKFRLARASGPRDGLDLELAVAAGDRLFAYATAGEGDGPRLLFEAPAGDLQPPDGRAVWAARVHPSPVLFGEGIRLPDGDGRFADVTPPEKTPADLVVDAFFLDEDRGWVLLADSETRSSRLLVTDDGGRGWAVGRFAPGPEEEARHLFFADRDNGWIVTYPAPQVSPKESSLYRTGDGGRTWTGPSPLPGCGPVHFDTPSHGWLADPGRRPTGCGLDRLHETTDGGRTWTKREVRPEVTPGRPQSVGYGPPRFDSGLLPAWVLEGDRSHAAFFESDDEGRTWDLAATAEFEGRREYPQASIADEGTWWAADADGSRISVTSDGGAHWRQSRPEGLRGRLVSLQAIDARRAWAVDSSVEGVRLVETLDGGATWRPLLSSPGPG